MLLKSKKVSAALRHEKDGIPSIITKDVNILGNITSDGAVDIDGQVDGNVRCHTLTVREHGKISGEVIVDQLRVYGKIKGLIRAKHVHLYSTCHIEGIVLHESITIEDGAYLDGKCKRSDKLIVEEKEALPSMPFDNSDDETTPAVGGLKMLGNIRLIS